MRADLRTIYILIFVSCQWDQWGLNWGKNGRIKESSLVSVTSQESDQLTWHLFAAQCAVSLGLGFQPLDCQAKAQK